jgi:hypothetical protein
MEITNMITHFSIYGNLRFESKYNVLQMLQVAIRTCRGKYIDKKKQFNLLISTSYKNENCCFYFIECPRNLLNLNFTYRASWYSGQSFWLLIIRSQVRFPVLPWGSFLEEEDFHGDRGLGNLVERSSKAPPFTSYSYITIHLIGTT